MQSCGTLLSSAGKEDVSNYWLPINTNPDCLQFLVTFFMINYLTGEKLNCLLIVWCIYHVAKNIYLTKNSRTFC